jgi:hypothetical protein
METPSSMDVPAHAANSVWQCVRMRLENERERVAGEIREYPTPIPRCDAQFNHLIEQRDSIVRGLQRLDEMAVPPTAEARTALEAFIDESSLSESLKQELRSLVRGPRTEPVAT